MTVRKLLTFLILFLTGWTLVLLMSPQDKPVDSGENMQLRAKIGQIKKELSLAGELGPPIQHDIPIIYAITPTFSRLVQKAELTRLSHTLLLVPNLHWIIVEDSTQKTHLVEQFLLKSGLQFTHLFVPTPQTMKLKKGETRVKKPRGVAQRNAGLSWLRENVAATSSGVVYFADDDNTYSLQLFDTIRWTKKVSVFPVGLVGGLAVERPRVENGAVVGWDVVFGRSRPFAVDMAGFAVHVGLIIATEAVFKEKLRIGYQETAFLQQLKITLQDLEPKSVDSVEVWHTRTQDSNMAREKKFREIYQRPSNDGIEV